MIGNALLLALALFMTFGFVLMDRLKFLVPYRQAIFHEYGWAIGLYRTLLQTFRTKIFLALSDDFSTRFASELCGREDKPFVTYNISGSGQDSKLSLLTGNPVKAEFKAAIMMQPDAFSVSGQESRRLSQAERLAVSLQRKWDSLRPPVKLHI